MGIRCTSKAAFIENEHSGANSTKRAQIFSFILTHPGCSRGDIERKVGIKINCVSGRVSELLQSKLIYEEGCKHDEHTGKSVNKLFAVQF
jgi:predicted transcriptional regulator